MKKIIALAFGLILAVAMSAQAGFEIGPYVGYDFNFTNISVPRIGSVTSSGGGLGGGLKLGYVFDVANMGLGLGLTYGCEPLYSSKIEVPGAAEVDYKSYSLPAMAYGQLIFGSWYLIGKIGLDNISNSTSGATAGYSVSGSESGSYLGMAVGAGLRIPIASMNLEIQGLYHYIADPDSDNAFTLNVGYNFGL